MAFCSRTVLLLVAVSAVHGFADIHGDNVDNLIVSTTEFAVDLYNEIAKERDMQNIVYSPVSVASALVMLNLGARSNSTLEINKVLHVSDMDASSVISAFGELQGLLFDKPQPNITLKGANAAFISDKFFVLDDFKDALSVFQAEIFKLDFSDKKASMSTVNKWISEKTEGLITEMVDEDTLTDVTSMLLSNTLYFSGEWHSGFNPKMTDERAFYVSHYRVIKTPFMFQRGKFRYKFVESAGIEILELSYVGEEISMFVILPDNFDLSAVEKKMSYENLKDWTSNLHSETVDVTLPKFKIESSVNLKGPLQRLGLESIFDSKKADLSGITGDKSQYVDEVSHKGVLEVTEEGSTAAAATTVRLVARSIQHEVKFFADRPFLWILRDNDSGHILFLGRFARPDGVEMSHEEL